MAGVGTGIAFSTATVFSYFLDSVWTFRWKLPVGSLRPFVVVAFMGLSATVAMTTAIQNAGYPYQVGIMAVVAFCAVAELLVAEDLDLPRTLFS